MKLDFGQFKAFPGTGSNPYAGLHRPRGLQEVVAARISRHSAHVDGKFDIPRHRPSLLL
jgi:hypothetical protein